MIKRFVFLAFALALAAAPAKVLAQAYGQFTSAPVLPPNGHLVGGYLISSSSTLGLLGQLRMSFYPGIDFGFQGGFARNDFEGEDRTTIRLGTDLKYQMTPAGADYAISIGGGLGVESGDHWNVISVGPSVVGSRAFPGDGGLLFTPYVGASIMFTNVNVASDNQSDMSLPLRLGSEVRLNPSLSLTGELQLRLGDDFNDDVGFALGVNSPF